MPSIQMYMACTFSPCGSFMYMCLMALLRWELAEVAMAAVLTRGFLQGTTTNSPSCEPFPACPHFSAAPLPTQGQGGAGGSSAAGLAAISSGSLSFLRENTQQLRLALLQKPFKTPNSC